MDALIKQSEIKIFPDTQSLFLSAADDFMQRANAAVIEKNVFTVALSGGNTPKQFFQTLSAMDKYRQGIPWAQIKFFFGDERYLAGDDPNTNYMMADANLFSKLPILPENIFRIPTLPLEPLVCALEYETTLKTQLDSSDNNIPQFDLIYLGLGGDGHTASLMPNSNIVEYYSQSIYTHNSLLSLADTSSLQNSSTTSNYQHSTNLVVAFWVPALNMYRITLTPTIINQALQIVFLVDGANKSSAVFEVLEGNYEPEKFPAQLIHGLHNKNVWYMDKEAADKLISTKH